MVEIKDIAIIFSRKLLDDDNFEFTPIKVVEGYYEEMDDWFVDKEGNTYVHIYTDSYSGNVYGCRMNIALKVEKYPYRSFAEIKDEIFEFAKGYRYITNNDGYIMMVDKNNDDEFLFKDMDYKNKEKAYEEINADLKKNIKDNDVSDGNHKDIENDYNTWINSNPSVIASLVKENIKGQDNAIDKIVTTILMNRKYPELLKKNMLLIGPSGVGKTAIFQELSKILKIPLVIFSTPGLSQAGYVGKDVNDILTQLLAQCDNDIDLAEKAIIVLDEIDKLSYKGENSGIVATEGVQNELLKLIEGDIREVRVGNNKGMMEKTVYIDTKDITFIGLGAFSELYNIKDDDRKIVGFNTSNGKKKEKRKIGQEDIVKYGLKRELVGRLSVIEELNNLDVDNLKDIITNSKNSELNKILNIFKDKGIKCSNIDVLIDNIAKDAYERKLGARGLITTLSDIFMKIFYDILNTDIEYEELILGDNILVDRNDYQLIKKDVKVKKLVNTSLNNN